MYIELVILTIKIPLLLHYENDLFYLFSAPITASLMAIL